MAKTAGDVLVETIIDWGVDTVFGIPDDDRQHEFADGRERRHLARVEPDRLGQFAAMAARIEPAHPAVDAGRGPGDRQHDNRPHRASLAHCRKKVARAVGPGEMLSGAQQQHQPAGGETGADTGRQQQQPEPP